MTPIHYDILFIYNTCTHRFNCCSSFQLFLLLFQALNELCEGQGWGIEVTGGHIGSVTVNVPYESLLAKDSSIEVSNLMISLRPKARPTDGTSMLESMWSSMSSSMQLAQEYLERESTGGSIADGYSTHSGRGGGGGGGVSGSGASGQQLPPSAMEGLENFAQIIDNGKLFIVTVIRNANV